MTIWQPKINCGHMEGEYPQAFITTHSATDGFKTEQECDEWIDYCIENGCFTYDELSGGVYAHKTIIKITPTFKN